MSHKHRQQNFNREEQNKVDTPITAEMQDAEITTEEEEKEPDYLQNETKGRLSVRNTEACLWELALEVTRMTLAGKIKAGENLEDVKSKLKDPVNSTLKKLI